MRPGELFKATIVYFAYSHARVSPSAENKIGLL